MVHPCPKICSIGIVVRLRLLPDETTLQNPSQTAIRTIYQHFELVHPQKAIIEVLSFVTWMGMRLSFRAW